MIIPSVGVCEFNNPNEQSFRGLTVSRCNEQGCRCSHSRDIKGKVWWKKTKDRKHDTGGECGIENHDQKILECRDIALAAHETHGP